MKNIKCDNCGADMEYIDGQYKCPYCGGIKAAVPEEKTEKATNEVSSRSLEKIRADYDKVYGMNIKMYVLLLVLFAVSIASALLGYFTFSDDDFEALPIIAILLFSVGYSGVLILCFYVLKVNYKRFVAVSDELFDAEKGNDPRLSKHAGYVCSFYKIRMLFAILPLLEAAFVFFMIIMD